MVKPVARINYYNTSVAPTYIDKWIYEVYMGRLCIWSKNAYPEKRSDHEASSGRQGAVVIGRAIPSDLAVQRSNLAPQQWKQQMIYIRKLVTPGRRCTCFAQYPVSPLPRPVIACPFSGGSLTIAPARTCLRLTSGVAKLRVRGMAVRLWLEIEHCQLKIPAVLRRYLVQYNLTVRHLLGYESSLIYSKSESHAGTSPSSCSLFYIKSTHLWGFRNNDFHFRWERRFPRSPTE